MTRPTPHRRPARAPRLAALALALAVAGCGGREAGAPLSFERPVTALDYEVFLAGAPTDEIEDLLRESLGVFRRRDDGAQSVAFLRRRALDDVDIARRVLRAYGYFEADMDVAVAPPAAEGEKAEVSLTVLPGRPFTLARHDFRLIETGARPPAPLDALRHGSPVGAPAEAQPILDAEASAAIGLRDTGRPYAALRGRDAVADLETAEIEVETTIATGPPLVFGETVIEGLRRVKPEYLLTYRNWEEGQPYSMRQLAAFQRRLVGTGLFAAVSASPPETPPEGEAAPVVVRVEEGKRRTVTAGARASTDRGVALRGSFEHRNMFGANETGRLEALVGTDEQRLEGRYLVPQYRRDRQDFVAGFSLRHIEDDAFDETAGTLTVGLEREVGRYWRVGAGGLLEVNETKDRDGRRTFFLAGLPFFAAFDDTGDLLNPTSGFRLRADVTPFTGTADSGGDPLFIRADTVASTYYPIDADRRYVLAGYGRLGSIVTTDDAEVPSSRRLYSGGGGSVRGYAARSIGPLDDRGDPLGGLSVFEIGAELRAEVSPPFGLAAFVEGGAISEEQFPVFDEGMQVGAGVGVRYMSPIGPIRLDVAVPLDKRPEDDSFQIYLAIGQAF